MYDTIDYILSSRPAYPWSLPGIGLPALIIVAIGLVYLTIKSYSGHTRLSRKRLLILIGLRLLALLVAVLTAIRPSVGILEEPKLPSTLLVGIDMSESMTVKDEAGNTARIDAVRRAVDRCQPTIDALRNEQNVNVVFYGFGAPDFTEATGAYDPKLPAAGKRSDYGTYLARTLERWQGERFVRGHLLIGDGADNGTTTSAIAEAAKWRRTAPIHAFGVGSKDTPSTARDVAITDAIADPNPVPAKTDFTLRLRVNAYGFVGARAPLKIQFDTGAGYQDVRIEQVLLAKDRDNIVEVALKAPELPEGKKSLEVKIRAEFPIENLPGDVNPTNNVIESYMTVTKDGLRVLVVDRLRYEYAILLDVLASDPRIDVRKVDLQTEAGGASLLPIFDFEENAYDVLILGNVSAKQLIAIDPTLPQRIADRVTKKGMGLIMLGGHASFLGEGPAQPKKADSTTGWQNVPEIQNILPVILDNGPPVEPKNAYDPDPKSGLRFGFMPNPRFADAYILKLGATRQESEQQWARLNDPKSRARFTGLSKIGTPRPTADVYAYASAADGRDLAGGPALDKLPPLLVGHQIGDQNRGRVLVCAAQDTFLWQRLGLPNAPDGINLHARFWRQLVLWLAHQETDDDAAFARPEFPRVPIGRKQRIHIGVKGKNGAVVLDPKFEVKVIAPGEAEAAAKPRPVTVDDMGKPIVSFDTSLSGEHRVLLTASGKTAAGEEVKADATAKFLAYAEATDEMLRTAADFDFLQKVATASGGRFHRLDDLPAFLKEMQSQPLDSIKPKPRYLPDWRRNHSKGFLPSWLLVFAALLVTEWALRRMWGLR